MTSQPFPTPSLASQTRYDLLSRFDASTFIDDPRLTAITDFAAALCNAPTALVSLVEDDRQFFVARTGLDARETPIETSFCAHAMLGDEVMVVPDALDDPMFAGNALVTGAPFIRFYAGAPLKARDGSPLGALCIIDQQPREGLTDIQRNGLVLLARSVMTLFEARAAEKLLEGDAATIRDELDDQQQRFRVLADTMPQMVWSTLPDGFHDYYNARWYDFTGVPPGSTDGEAWNGMFHPEDQDRAWARWRKSLATGEPYDIEYRLRSRDGTYRWVLGRALPIRNDEGQIVRWFGTCTDIHDQKESMEQREMISHELSHRIKNIFSVISGLIALSSREHPEIKGAADDLRDRVIALGKAHDFVRPHSDQSRPERDQTSLHGMLDELLEPYQSADGERIKLVGDEPGIDDRSATPLALLFHELATNAAKYGGLSTPEGRIVLTSTVGERQTQLRWRERGGPKLTSARTPGFGSRLIAMSVERQLGGTLDQIFHDDGLEAVVTIPNNAMRRVENA